MSTTIQVYHPKTVELSATITIGEDGYCVITTGFRYLSSEADTYEEAYSEAQRMLEEVYSGEYHREMAADARYSRQERYACSGEY